MCPECALGEPLADPYGSARAGQPLGNLPGCFQRSSRVGCHSHISGIDYRSSTNAFPQTHQVDRCRRRGHRGRGRFLRDRQRNLQRRLSRCQQRLRWRSRIRRRGIQRSVWTGLRRSIWHGRQRVHVELHNLDISGSEGDRPRGVLHDIPEGDELGLGERHYSRRTRPRTQDDQRNHHHGRAGHRATDWQRRICDFLGGKGDPLPARCTDHVKAGRSDPGELQSGVGDDRQRNGSE